MRRRKVARSLKCASIGSILPEKCTTNPLGQQWLVRALWANGTETSRARGAEPAHTAGGGSTARPAHTHTQRSSTKMMRASGGEATSPRMALAAAVGWKREGCRTGSRYALCDGQYCVGSACFRHVLSTSAAGNKCPFQVSSHKFPVATGHKVA
jgi:hypothetical protein